MVLQQCSRGLQLCTEQVLVSGASEYNCFSVLRADLSVRRDVGLLRYWTLAQLPNFILAGPILILLGLTLRYTSGSADAMLRSILKPGSSPQPLPRSGVAISFANTPHLVPHLLFTWITALLLVFASHVQIALRFASPGGLPAVWWAAASVVRRTEQVEPHKRLKITRLGSVLCAYLVIWNITSLVLYGGFYPPA